MKKEALDFCKKRGLTEAQFYGLEQYKGSLVLNGLTSIPEGFNPTVGGYLYLRNLTSIPDRLKEKNIKRTGNAIPWPCGRYISADGIFTEILSRKGNVYKVRRIASDKVFYLVTDGNDNWSHGDTLQAAKSDLRFKLKGDPDNYRHLTIDSVLPVEDAIAAYRGITGACSTGVRMFMDEVNANKKKYSVKEICDLTVGRYGHEQFKSFFVTPEMAKGTIEQWIEDNF